MKTSKEYYEEELNVIRERRRAYTTWGCSPDVRPLVDILSEAEDKIEEELKKF